MILTRSIHEKELKKEQKTLILFVFPLVFFIAGVLCEVGFNDGNISLFTGLKNIVLSPTLLITDFLEIGGVGAAFLNSALIGFFNLFLLKKYK